MSIWTVLYGAAAFITCLGLCYVFITQHNRISVADSVSIFALSVAWPWTWVMGLLILGLVGTDKIILWRKK